MGEEPIELQGLPQEPDDLQRTKYFYDDEIEIPAPDQQPRIDYIDYDYTDGQKEETENEDRQESLFYRKNRMDVKKPGPFVEASPNNFYLDKMSYDRYDDTDDIITNDTSKDSGQEEYEIPMPQPAPSKEKRIAVNPQDPAEEVLGKTENNNNLNDYVHIALNNKFREWREGSDFINALAWELGLPEDALTDRTIENQHVQFKVDANPQNVDAAKVAEVLEEDINLKKRLTDTLGVDVANVAASHRADRSSVFPEGNNLNLLILVVVGASATASLLVGGLVLALTRRNKVAKKVNKLQLSDDVEDRGKMHEEYKQLCRDWSKTKQSSPTSTTNSGTKPMSTTQLPNYPTTPNYTTTQLPNNPTTQLPNHPATR